MLTIKLTISILMAQLLTSPISSYRGTLDLSAIVFLLNLMLLISVALFHYCISCPRDLRHLPRVSIIRLLISYLTVEEENHRTQRLLMPFAQRGHGVVVVWALGRWMVHILDEKVGYFSKEQKIVY